MKDKSYKQENITNLSGFCFPTVKRDDEGNVLSVGINQGQRYYNYSDIKSSIVSSLIYDKDTQKKWNRGYLYDSEIANLIDKGNIYIKKEKKEIKKTVEISNQSSLF
jgi:hypothetical protein